MSFGQLILLLYIFALSIFAGYQIISKVPQLLHTPLMAFTNAISGISLVASLVVAGAGTGTEKATFSTILGTIAVAAATINVVGGFLITDRMLKMFRKKPVKPAAGVPGAPGSPPPSQSGVKA
jgi:NAD(P) transhydrogenase subunit alpha